jgi:hypothetical protein
MKFSQASVRSDENWCDSSEGALFVDRRRLAQFQIRMDRETSFPLILRRKNTGRQSFYSLRRPRKSGVEYFQFSPFLFFIR